MSKTPDVAGALAAMKAATRGPRKRSPVYTWMANRYDELDAAFRQQPPSWKALAEYLADGGVMNADKKPPTAASVRTSWVRLVEDMARKRSRVRQGASPIPPFPNRSRLQPADAEDDPTDDGPPLPDFSKPVKG